MANSSTAAGRIPILFFWRLLGSSVATQWYKVHPYRMNTQEVANLYGGSILVEFYLMADSSTTTGRILILCSGGCWARR